MINLVSIVILFSLLLQFTAFAQPLLKGNVQHSESLTPIEKYLFPGAHVDVTRLRRLTPNNFWFRIPAWAAGTWKGETNTTYSKYWYQTGNRNFAVDTFMARGADTWGQQMDRNGNIWTYQGTNFWTVTEGQYYWTFSFVKSFDPIEVSAEKIVVQFLGYRVLVDKNTSMVLRSYQAESIQTYTTPLEGMKKVDGSIKVFDSYGRPICLSKVVSFDRRVLPFIRVDNRKGMDYRSLFDEYLSSHGLLDLLPKSKVTMKNGSAGRKPWIGKR